MGQGLEHITGSHAAAQELSYSVGITRGSLQPDVQGRVIRSLRLPPASKRAQNRGWSEAARCRCDQVITLVLDQGSQDPVNERRVLRRSRKCRGGGNRAQSPKPRFAHKLGFLSQGEGRHVRGFLQR